MRNEIFNCDCMEFMKSIPDKYIDLACCDPMYIMPKSYYLPGNEKSGKTGIKRKYREQAKKLSNTKPIEDDYIKEILRISKHQIIWGINTFPFSNFTPGRIVWDKENDSSVFSDCEIAACSLHIGIKIFRYRWSGFLQKNMKNKEKRIHSFQKPVALGKWQLQNYAKPGWKIFDSHVGSGYLRIACHDMGFYFVGCEIEKECWEAQEKRFKNHIEKGSELFDLDEYQELIYNQSDLTYE